MVSKTLLDELKMIIAEDYGVDLASDEVSDLGNSLVRFVELLIKLETQSAQQ